MRVQDLIAIDAGAAEEYPLGREVRLDSHGFIPWERRRWLASSMRMRATPECRAIYFDLICISFDQSPIGTLPGDIEELAKLAMVPEGHFRALCMLPFGPLHNWRPCLSEGERRIWQPMVLRTIETALDRRQRNEARVEGAAAAKRVERLRAAVATYDRDLARDAASIAWMDGWLVDQRCGYRTGDWIERALAAWMRHMRALGARDPGLQRPGQDLQKVS